MKRLFRQFGRRGQSGQALVVLAIGFIGLLGFVGIVTDVSLLFIRYSTMRRAVDAASVAAAGQMRRVADRDFAGQGGADSVANLNLAARQFIQLYGLDPTNVLVETCRAQQVNRAPDQTPLDRNGVPLMLSGWTPNPAANEDDVQQYLAICTPNEDKLVRVTAQIESPTIFMRLLGYNTITLTESAISQTAVIDVVLVFDVSESMLNDTSYDDWDQIPTVDPLQPQQGVRYMPPYVSYADVYYDHPEFTPPKKNAFSVLLGSTQGWNGTRYVDADPVYGLTNPAGGLNYLIRDTNPDLATSRYYHLGDRLESFEWVGGTWQACNPDADPRGACTNGTGRVEPREFCQVRAYPYAHYGIGAARVPEELHNDYAAYYSAAGALDAQFGNSGNTYQYSGFVPMYNYYGCCNDPNGDGNFGDLICQPFREARDAAEGFLARLDFLRGDRVAFVTFDRFATVIDPDGDGVQSAMLESEFDFLDADGNTYRGATTVLNAVVGVKAEESSYVDSDGDGYWDRLMDGGDERTQDELLNSVTIGNIIDNPVYRACPYDKAVSHVIYTNANTMPLDGSERYPYDTLMNHTHSVPSWFAGADDFDLGTRSYEYRASCRGTNIGGALAAGSNTLFSAGRREGAVWIMVLLSDGAAGASNVVSRTGIPPGAPNPYNVTVEGWNNPYNALGYDGALRDDSVADYEKIYGAFGLCPYGTNANRGELLSDPENIPPYCLDQFPETRNYCSYAQQNPARFRLSVAVPDETPPNCYEFYDVDDYARDWADWIGIADLPNATTGATSGRTTDQLLPTIFTIGFGLNYDKGWCAANGYAVDDYDCQRGLNPGNQTYREDYLGEELLRYIADVGDNFQIDNDYWQKHMSVNSVPPSPLQPRIRNSIATPGDENYGARGTCEESTPADLDDRGNAYQPLAPMESCGNYFVAASGTELEAVFNEIASRMFTRLSQ